MSAGRINLSGTPALPNRTQLDEAMIWVSEALGATWRCNRLGATWHFTRNGDFFATSRRRDFRDAVAEVTGLTVIK